MPLSAQARGEELLEVTDSETATIDGRNWDTPITGGRTVDAVHRSVLLCFPDAAGRHRGPAAPWEAPAQGRAVVAVRQL